MPHVAGFYLLLFGATFIAKLPKPNLLNTFSKMARLPVSFILVTLAVITGFTWQHVARQPNGMLHVTVLDVGSGDAVLIQSPSGRYILVDGGSSTIALSEALGRRLPILNRHLDWVILGGTNHDQIAGLAGIVERYPIGNVLLAGPAGRSAYRRLIDELTEAGCPIVAAEDRQRLEMGDGAIIEVIAVGERGVILLITFNRARILLSPGADPSLVTNLVRERSINSVTAALMADGGFSAVNPPEWLNQLRPLLAIISVEAGNRRGLPSPMVLEALEDTTVLRTDLHGWVKLTSDGEHLWVEVERSLESRDGEHK